MSNIYAISNYILMSVTRNQKPVDFVCFTNQNFQQQTVQPLGKNWFAFLLNIDPCFLQKVNAFAQTIYVSISVCDKPCGFSTGFSFFLYHMQYWTVTILGDSTNEETDVQIIKHINVCRYLKGLKYMKCMKWSIYSNKFQLIICKLSNTSFINFPPGGRCIRTQLPPVPAYLR